MITRQFYQMSQKFKDRKYSLCPYFLYQMWDKLVGPMYGYTVKPSYCKTEWTLSELRFKHLESTSPSSLIMDYRVKSFLPYGLSY